MERITDAFFDGNPIFSDLDKISNYQYAIAYTKVPLLTEEQVLNAIAGILVTAVTQRLDAREIYVANNLSVRIDANQGVLITFADDVYHFIIQMDSDGFMLIRKGSSLREFLEVADLLFDYIPEWFEQIATYLNNLNSAGGPLFRLSPYYCAYTFSFILENFAPAGKSTRKSIPNYELMEKIVPSAQTISSPLSGIGYETRGRTDLKVSGTIKVDPVDWLCWTHIDAPGNKNYSTMNVMFQATSTVHDYMEGRKPFNPESLDKWRMVTLDLLKERFLDRFLNVWLSDVKFQSAER